MLNNKLLGVNECFSWCFGIFLVQFVLLNEGAFQNFIFWNKYLTEWVAFAINDLHTRFVTSRIDLNGRPRWFIVVASEVCDAAQQKSRSNGLNAFVCAVKSGHLWGCIRTGVIGFRLLRYARVCEHRFKCALFWRSAQPITSSLLILAGPRFTHTLCAESLLIDARISPMNIGCSCLLLHK